MALLAKRNSIVQSIKAGSSNGLLRLIDEIETRDGIVYDWEIQQQNDGKWIAFYRRNIHEFMTVEESDGDS